MGSKTKIVVFKAKELIYTGIFIVLGIILILLLIFMFTPTKDTKKTKQTSGYIDGVYSTPISLGENQLELRLTVKDGKPTKAALKHLNKDIKTMYPLIEPSLESINQQLPKINNLEELDFGDKNQYTNTLLKQGMKNALKQAKE